MGHNHKWNRDSLIGDKAGHGMIFSPVNMKSEDLEGTDVNLKKKSFLDPQFYLIDATRGKLPTYNFYPANIRGGCNTEDFKEISKEVARKCIDYQLANDFKYLVVPTRYCDELPTDYYDKLNESIIDPFIEYCKKIKTKKEILITVILKPIQLSDDDMRDEFLNWITGIQGITGVYLIFETRYGTKQIKDTGFLHNALTIIHILRSNDLEVHIGYNNTEGLLYSIAMPNSISMGSYENLRNFSIKRFESSEGPPRGPRPRLYMGKLFQWIDYGYIDAIKKMYKKHQDLFEDSNYKPLMFEPSYNWHFTKPEPYKHFFVIFSSQITHLPKSSNDRINYLETSINSAIGLFQDLQDSGIILDENSDGSHLKFWLTTINMYKKSK